MQNKNLQNTQSQFVQAIACTNVNQELCDVIYPGGSLKTPQEALGIYSRAYKATLTEALGETFEGVWSVLGDERFFVLAEKYINETPSQSYNLSDYGETLPSFLKNYIDSKDYPFLIKLAEFEWIFKILFHSECPNDDVLNTRKNDLNPSSKLKFKNSMKIFKSDFSVYEIWKQRKDQEMIPSINESQNLLIFKNTDETIWVVKLLPWQFHLMTLLIEDTSIEVALMEVVDFYQVQDAKEIQSFFQDLGSYPIFD